MAKVWLVRCGPRGKRLEEFRKGGYVSIGYDLMEDLRGEADRQAVLAAVRRAKPDLDHLQTLSRYTGEIMAFLQGIEPYDYILTPTENPLRFLLGYVNASRPEFLPERSQQLEHGYRWCVRWEPEFVTVSESVQRDLLFYRYPFTIKLIAKDDGEIPHLT